MRKLLVGLIILMFIGMSITQSTSAIAEKKSNMSTSRGDILYVGGDGPGNYSKIKDAVDNTSDGDTVFVYNGLYYEFNIVINKSIRLIGEDKLSTIIDAELGRNTILFIYADNVNISGFTIQKCGYSGSGIFIKSSNSNIIAGNMFIDNWHGIDLDNSDFNTIVDNAISDSSTALRFKYSGNNMIRNNNISDNFNAFFLDLNSNNNTFASNKILDNNNGLHIRDSNGNIFEDNTISNNGDHTWEGIRFYSCNSNIITRNTIINNYGIYLGVSSNNIITDNSFLNDGLRVWGSYQNTVTNNTVNDKPLVYLENESDMVIDVAGQVILIECDNITVQNQDLSNTVVGIELWDTSNCFISNNIISNNYNGMNIYYYCSDNIITSNTISDNRIGIWLREYSCDNILMENIISDNRYGIQLWASNDNTIKHNNVISNINYGIILSSGLNNTITDNNISSNNNIGLYLRGSNNIIKVNDFSGNEYGMYVLESNNIIYHNNFIDNEYNAKDKSSNTWNDRYPFGGNYWSNYNGVDNFSGPNQDIPGSDGIGDTPYSIPGEWQSNNEDMYPLMEPFANQPPLVEILNPRKGYIHFSGIPFLPTLFNLIADTMSIGGFKSRPIIVMATDDFDKSEDLIVKIYINGEEKGNASYCWDWKLHEWFWTEKAQGLYLLVVTAEDTVGLIGSAEMEVWNFCLFQ